MPDYIVEAKNVCKSVGDVNKRFEILKNVNLCVKNGEYVAIMGPSGSGKSTFLSILSCIDKPTSGIVNINYVDVAKLSKNKLTEFRNENIGIVFQSFNLIPTLNAEENIEIPLFFSKKKINIINKVDELINIVGLKDKKDFPKTIIGW